MSDLEVVIDLRSPRWKILDVVRALRQRLESHGGFRCVGRSFFSAPIHNLVRRINFSKGWYDAPTVNAVGFIYPIFASGEWTAASYAESTQPVRIGVEMENLDALWNAMTTHLCPLFRETLDIRTFVAEFVRYHDRRYTGLETLGLCSLFLGDVDSARRELAESASGHEGELRGGVHRLRERGYSDAQIAADSATNERKSNVSRIQAMLARIEKSPESSPTLLREIASRNIATMKLERCMCDDRRRQGVCLEAR